MTKREDSNFHEKPSSAYIVKVDPILNALKMKQTFSLLLVLFSAINLSLAQSFLQLGNDLDGESANDFSGGSVSMPDYATIAIGATSNDGNGTDAGHVRVFHWDGNTWNQMGSDIDGEAAGDETGRSLSMPDKNTIAIGAPRNDGNGNQSGQVRIFRWNGSTWVQKGNDIDGEAPDDLLGYSVSMPDSNTVAIGAPFNDGSGLDIGHARVYSWNGTVWIQKGADIDGAFDTDQWGRLVNMPDSNTIVIGAPFSDGNGPNSGSVRIYRWNGNAWIQKGSDIYGEQEADNLGWSASMPDSNTIAVGAPYNDGNGLDAGHTRIFKWNGNAWIQKGNDIDAETATDYAGYAVSMPDSNTLAVGAQNNNGNGSNSGHVRIYRWNGNMWVIKGTDIDGELAGDRSGFSVSMPDSNVVGIGALVNDDGGTDAGQARVFFYDAILNIHQPDENLQVINSYPNPTRGTFYIEMKSYWKDASVIIRNSLGQKIAQKTYCYSDVVEVNLDGEAGIYFIEVQTTDRQVFLKVTKE